MATLVRLIFLGSVVPSLHLHLMLSWHETSHIVWCRSNESIVRVLAMVLKRSGWPFSHSSIPSLSNGRGKDGVGYLLPLSKRDSAQSLLSSGRIFIAAFSTYTRQQDRTDSSATSHDLQIHVRSGSSTRE